MARREGRRRKGRGRLSRIDMLPEIAAPDIQWAVDELLANQRTQAEILTEFNERLAAHGIEPISATAFNRHSLRVAALTARMKETQDVTRAIVDRLGPDSGDQLTIGLAVLLKQALLEAREKGFGDPESLMFMSRSLQSIVSAQKTSADLRRAAEQEVAAKLKKAAEAVKVVGRERGLDAALIEQISAGIMGVSA